MLQSRKNEQEEHQMTFVVSYNDYSKMNEYKNTIQ